MNSGQAIPETTPAGDMPEVRVDVLTGRAVILVPGRAARPGARHRDPMLPTGTDPFAEGAEDQTPDECYAVRPQATLSNSPGWLLRVVPNRYPITAPLDLKTSPPASAAATATDGEAWGDADGLFPAAPFFGRHEVVIECPDHRSRLLELSASEILEVLLAWRERSGTLIAQGQFRTLAIYRNEGFSAGASLSHCHSQILAACRLSRLDQTRQERAAAYQKRHQRDLLADLLAAEDEAGIRVISRSDRFTVLCPFAPRSAWHVRFVPRPLQPAFFHTAETASLEELARLLPAVLTAIEAASGGGVPMNLVLAQPPVDRPAAWSWMLELLPRLSKQAGWELLTDEDTFPGRPETWAAAIRRELSGLSERRGAAG